ncbi:MAG: NADH-quinone oxidoreductase subunit M [Candidatus Dadabacteria bacterium]|nr:MAG: NADH-quinone oxidoreductase subunit M [Candidatus Dadabacteria bacterium]
MVFSPALGSLAVAAVPPGADKALRRTALLVSFVPFVLALVAWARFDPADGGFQLIERTVWIERFGISYFLGIDGISLLLVLLTVFLTPLVVLSAPDTIHHRLKGYLVAMLLLETTMLGTLVALDALLFYVFWEAMLVPMFLIIGIWGGERRVYAAIKFLLFTMVGSLPMLAALVYMAIRTGDGGQMSFAITDFYGLALSPTAQAWACSALALAFAIKVPMWPLHTWLPDAHVEAPTGGSVILAGVLLKMGTYGFVRFVMPLFPDVVPVLMPWIGGLAVVGIVYGALVAMVQPDLKKLVAYSSVSHLGFVMLGLASLNAVGVEGAVYQMLNHGLSTGALFLLVGMIYERRHTRLIAEFGGLWKQLPVYAACFLVIMLSSAGLPGLNGFVGEFLIIVGAFRTQPALAAVAATGVILGAVYLLWMYQRVMFGPLDNPANRSLSDLSRREIAVLVPILVMVIVMGVYPKPFLGLMHSSVDLTLARAGRKAAVVAATAVEQGQDARGCGSSLEGIRACGEYEPGEASGAFLPAGSTPGASHAGATGAGAGGAR